MDSVTVERVARSSDELALIGSIVDHLADDTRRLAYADWLAQNGDPRGLLLRDFVEAYRTGGRLPALDGASAAWADLAGLAITQKIMECGLRSRRDELLALARPALRLEVA